MVGLAPPAVAEQGDASVCIQAWRNGMWQCGIGVENLECGRSWHCKTLTAGGCPCLAYSTKAADGCVATGEWKAEHASEPAPGATIEFTLTPDADNRLVIADFADITDDGVLERYMEFRGAEDFVGTFSVTFGAGPEDAIPFHITDLSLQVRRFNFRGFDTGLNTVFLGADVAEPAGRFDSRTGEITSLRSTRCIGYNNIFPGGYAVDIRPCMRRTRDGNWGLLPMAVSQFDDCTGDFNADHRRDLIDLAELLSGFGTDAGDPDFQPELDIDHDGQIALGDLTHLMIRFGRSCP